LEPLLANKKLKHAALHWGNLVERTHAKHGLRPEPRILQLAPLGMYAAQTSRTKSLVDFSSTRLFSHYVSPDYESAISFQGFAS
jgi:hypothetical protein